MNRFSLFPALFRHSFGKTTPGQRWRAPPSFRPVLEELEDRTALSLIASQVLPVLAPPGGFATANTVVVLAPALSGSSPTPQQITLTDTIPGATGGTVNFTVAGV